MRICTKGVATISLVLLSTAGAVWAEDAKKPAGPTLSDVLDSSGLTLTGYIDGTYTYATASPKISPDLNTFALNQAAFTLAKQPTDGFGGLVNVIAGTDAPCLPGGTGTCGVTSSGFVLLQAYAQYAYGKATFLAGKFVTLAGAEVVAPTGNTNITRSILFMFEPVTHTGVRLAFAATDKASFTIGVNNGWNSETNTPDKTAELGFSWAPSKAFSLSAAGYYGRTDCEAKGVNTNCGLADLVLTWNATSNLSLVGSVDYGEQDKGNNVLPKNVSWTGYALYANYTFNEHWRGSLRGEMMDDSDGYLYGPNAAGKGQTVSEGTLTFAYMPAKNFEVRIEGRYDTSDSSYSKGGLPDITQGWLQALYKF